ncbi:MAG: hypothetical protein VYA53_07300 [Acidobacteriota bacterium]|nr:hypothetical protein [Acidobacteriota bacterium]
MKQANGDVPRNERRTLRASSLLCLDGGTARNRPRGRGSWSAGSKPSQDAGEHWTALADYLATMYFPNEG